MKKPTKVWKFADVYKISCDWTEDRFSAEVLINWSYGQSLFDRAVLDLRVLANEIFALGWTCSNCEHERVGNESGLKSFSILFQFSSEAELSELKRDCLARLKEISELQSDEASLELS